MVWFDLLFTKVKLSKKHEYALEMAMKLAFFPMSMRFMSVDGCSLT